MDDHQNRIALVTGATQGIGYEIVKQLAEKGVTVLMGSQTDERGQKAKQDLTSEGLDVSFITFDVCDRATIKAAADKIQLEYGRLDILINNAGIADEKDGAPSVASVDAIRRILEVNFLGPVSVTQEMLPLLRASQAGRIVNMSSSLGSLNLNADSSSPYHDVLLVGYNASKAALNMQTIQLNTELEDTGITAVSACPGLVNTALSGNRGERTPKEAAAHPVQLALNEKNTSMFQSAEGEVPW